MKASSSRARLAASPTYGDRLAVQMVASTPFAAAPRGAHTPCRAAAIVAAHDADRRQQQRRFAVRGMGAQQTLPSRAAPFRKTDAAAGRRGLESARPARAARRRFAPRRKNAERVTEIARLTRARVHLGIELRQAAPPLRHRRDRSEARRAAARICSPCHEPLRASDGGRTPWTRSRGRTARALLLRALRHRAAARQSAAKRERVRAHGVAGVFIRRASALPSRASPAAASGDTGTSSSIVRRIGCTPRP